MWYYNTSLCSSQFSGVSSSCPRVSPTVCQPRAPRSALVPLCASQGLHGQHWSHVVFPPACLLHMTDSHCLDEETEQRSAGLEAVGLGLNLLSCLLLAHLLPPAKQLPVTPGALPWPRVPLASVLLCHWNPVWELSASDPQRQGAP